jgi:hypothetical protein
MEIPVLRVQIETLSVVYSSPDYPQSNRKHSSTSCLKELCMTEKSRRNFLVASASVVAAATPLSVMAGSNKHGTNGKGLVIDSAAKDTCGTCEFWGGYA